MTTLWTTPTIISQYAEELAEDIHIPWTEVDNFAALKSIGTGSVETVRELLHIARSPKHDVQMKTYYIQATGFNFVDMPGTISGIEVRISTKRYGRITDDVVQLSNNNLLIGDNKASLPILPVKIYGTDSDLWATEDLAMSDVTSSTFGVTLRFQSHLQWPHKDPAFITAIEMRIH